MFSKARCVAGAPVTVTYTPLDANGEPSAADPGTVTVGVTRSDGTVVVAAGAATVGSGVTLRTYTIAATHTATLDQLTVTWTASAVTVHRTTVDVVGGVFATVAEVRGVEPSLSDINDDTTAALLRARNEVEEMFERACGHTVSFVPRFDVVTVEPWDRYFLPLPHWFVRSVRWVKYTTTGGTVTSVDLSAGVTLGAGTASLNTGSWPTYRVLVGYEHGMDAPPADVKRQAILAIRRQQNQQSAGVDARAMSYQSVDGMNVQLVTPGLGPWVTGVPSIDEVLKWYRDKYSNVGVA